MKKTSFRTISILFILMTTATVAHANPASSGVPTMAELRNATYTEIEKGPVSLSNGRWEGNPYGEGGASQPTAGLVNTVYYTGELMRIEREYLDALLQVTSFRFHTGSLALNGQKKDGTPFNMLFSRAEKDINEALNTS